MSLSTVKRLIRNCTLHRSGPRSDSEGEEEKEKGEEGVSTPVLLPSLSSPLISEDEAEDIEILYQAPSLPPLHNSGIVTGGEAGVLVVVAVVVMVVVAAAAAAAAAAVASVVLMMEEEQRQQPRLLIMVM